MKIADSEVFAEYAKTPEEDRVFDFYRCYKCQSVFTREDELYGFRNADERGRICKCGSSKYGPGWPTWFGWLKPCVVRYTLKMILAREVAPWCEKHFQAALPVIEKLVRHRVR